MRHFWEVTNVLVLVLYRHAMQNAMVAYPETRKARSRAPPQSSSFGTLRWSSQTRRGGSKPTARSHQAQIALLCEPSRYCSDSLNRLSKTGEPSKNLRANSSREVSHNAPISFR